MTSGGVYDEDNWDCVAGECRYRGCLADAECLAEPSVSSALNEPECLELGCGISSCQATCTTVSDCVTAQMETNPLTGQDNWACTDGVCRYTGCNSDAECQEAWETQGGEYECVEQTGGVGACFALCEAASDCVSQFASPNFDEDNYACDEGRCRYLGCVSDAECEEANASSPGTYVCAESYFEL